MRIPKDVKVRGKNDELVTTTRGVREIFSYYGVLGMRVFAPIARNEYEVWQLVVQIPFLGQTSRGMLLESHSIHPSLTAHQAPARQPAATGTRPPSYPGVPRVRLAM